jgi:hypothetical protein
MLNIKRRIVHIASVMATIQDLCFINTNFYDSQVIFFFQNFGVYCCRHFSFTGTDRPDKDIPRLKLKIFKFLSLILKRSLKFQGTFCQNLITNGLGGQQVLIFPEL